MGDGNGNGNGSDHTLPTGAPCGSLYRVVQHDGSTRRSAHPWPASGLFSSLFTNVLFWRAWSNARFAVTCQLDLRPRPARLVEEMVVRGRVRVGNVPQAVTPREEVRPMNAVRTWVLPLVVTVGRLT